jgi:hypothetical protein
VTWSVVLSSFVMFHGDRYCSARKASLSGKLRKCPARAQTNVDHPQVALTYSIRRRERFSSLGLPSRPHYFSKGSNFVALIRYPALEA